MYREPQLSLALSDEGRLGALFDHRSRVIKRTPLEIRYLRYLGQKKNKNAN